MAPPRNRIGDILVKTRVIDDLQLRSALARLDQWGGRLSRTIVDMGLASEDTIVEAIARGLGLQRVQLHTVPRDAAALARLDVSLAEEKHLFPVALRDNGKTLMLAMSDPTDLQTVDQVVALTRLRVVPVVAGDQEIDSAIRRHYRNQDPSSAGFSGDPLVSRRPDEKIDEDEFKIVDMSGKTVMKRLADIDPRLAEPQPPPPAPAGASAPAAAPGSSAADLLDEILAGGGPSAPEFTEEELQRLRAVQANQEKSSKVLRALLELLFEKGALQQRELAARMRS